MNKPKFLIILRWVGVLPCAVLAFLVGYAIYYYGNFFVFDENSYYVKYVAPVIASIVAGFAYLHYGKTVAPFYKHYTGFALLLIITMINAIAIYLTIFDKQWLDLIKLIASLMGAITSYFIKTDEEMQGEV